MRTLKSLSEANFDKETLVHNEDTQDEEEFSSLETNEQNYRASNYTEYQEYHEHSDHEKTQLISKTESLNSMFKHRKSNENDCSELEKNKIKNFQSTSGQKYEALKDPEMLLDFDNIADSSDRKCWSLLLRCGRVTGIMLTGKTWRPVFVTLEGNTLKFHAEGFESSPPFKVIDLSWFFSFRIPGLKEELSHHEFLFTLLLCNSLPTSRGPLAKSRKGVLIGCANYAVLLDFMETVQECISGFPAFRSAGISYKMEKVLVHVLDTYEVIQQSKHNVDVTQQEKQSITLKQVKIMMKAKVSASPECKFQLRYVEGFSKMPASDDVSVHKCVKSLSSNNEIMTARFIPLDNCWFQLVTWKSSCVKPAPLHCEIIVAMSGHNSVKITAHIFTGSTHSEVKSASDIMLRFVIPSKWLEIEGKSAVQTIQYCTDVSKGNISYSSNSQTMLWSIPKLSLHHSCRNFYITGKPLATLNTLFKPSTSSLNAREVVEGPVEMNFYTKASAQSSEVAISSMKFGLKSFGKFKTNYTSVYRIKIPPVMVF